MIVVEDFAVDREVSPSILTLAHPSIVPESAPHYKAPGPAVGTMRNWCVTSQARASMAARAQASGKSPVGAGQDLRCRHGMIVDHGAALSK